MHFFKNKTILKTLLKITRFLQKNDLAEFSEV